MLEKFAGLAVAFFGFFLLMVSGYTRDIMIFQFSIIIALPSIYLGFKLMELI